MAIWLLLVCYQSWSQMFRVDFGVRQGSVPCRLLTYSQFIWIIIAQLGQFNRGMFIILYADDILLISPSIRQLQHLLLICESELSSLDMKITVKNLYTYRT